MFDFLIINQLIITEIRIIKVTIITISIINIIDTISLTWKCIQKSRRGLKYYIFNIDIAGGR